jgi:hypothetical protein
MPEVVDVLRGASVKVSRPVRVGASEAPAPRTDSKSSERQIVRDGPTWVVTLESRGRKVGLRLAREAEGEPWVIVEAVTIAREGPKSPLTPEDMRALPYGELLAQARGLVANEERPRVAEHVGGSVEANLSAFLADHKGVRIPDRDYALLAVEYVSLVMAGNRRPARTLSEQYGHGTPNAWAQRVREARRRGLLTKGTKGESGGRLTRKGERLLGL